MTNFIDEFIEFVAETMPSISPYTVKKIKSSISQFDFDKDKDCSKDCTIMESQYDFLIQGDIIENVPFYRINPNNGKLQIKKSKGLIITNTCDCSRDKNILIAPFIPIDKLEEMSADTIISMKKNKVYSKMYIPDNDLKDYIIDFSLMNTYNRELILKQVEDKKIKKLKSLNTYGFYLFICKMTIYFCRPEDEEVNSKRKEQFLKKVYS